MDITHAIILAIVEGLTEFLPISSTGHMIITSHLLNMPQTEFLKTFEIAIQLGAIGAVLLNYWRTFLLDWEIGVRILAAFVPTAIIGFLLYKIIKHYLLGSVLVVALALLIGGVLIIIFEQWNKKKLPKITSIKEISLFNAIIIGLAQSLSVIPGVSRSGATIVGGLWLGIERKVIVEFSFLLAVPTMFAAVVFDIIKSKASIQGQEWGILAVGFAVAFIVAWLSIKFMLSFIQKFNFIPFGIYRIILGIVLLSFLV